MSTVKLAVSTSVILTVYFVMIPFCWLMGGGVQESTKEVELTFAAIRSSGGALGAEKEILNYCVLSTKSYQRKHDSVNTIL